MVLMERLSIWLMMVSVQPSKVGAFLAVPVRPQPKNPFVCREQVLARTMIEPLAPPAKTTRGRCPRMRWSRQRRPLGVVVTIPWFAPCGILQLNSYLVSWLGHKRTVPLCSYTEHTAIILLGFDFAFSDKLEERFVAWVFAFLCRMQRIDILHPQYRRD